MTEFNINDRVKVKPKERGRLLLDKYWGGQTYTYKTDEDGYIEMQLWHAMHVFGPELELGMDPPIETTILLDHSTSS